MSTWPIARPGARSSTPRCWHLLGRMLELAMILRGRRFERGSLELNMPEVKIDLDEQGEVVGAHLRREHREPPDHRGVHAGGQRGGGRHPGRRRG